MFKVTNGKNVDYVDSSLEIIECFGIDVDNDIMVPVVDFCKDDMLTKVNIANVIIEKVPDIKKKCVFCENEHFMIGRHIKTCKVAKLHFVGILLAEDELDTVYIYYKDSIFYSSTCYFDNYTFIFRKLSKEFLDYYKETVDMYEYDLNLAKETLRLIGNL